MLFMSVKPITLDIDYMTISGREVKENASFLKRVGRINLIILLISKFQMNEYMKICHLKGI